MGSSSAERRLNVGGIAHEGSPMHTSARNQAGTVGLRASAVFKASSVIVGVKV
jgi:hypothetical protein